MLPCTLFIQCLLVGVFSGLMDPDDVAGVSPGVLDFQPRGSHDPQRPHGLGRRIKKETRALYPPSFMSVRNGFVRHGLV